MQAPAPGFLGRITLHHGTHETAMLDGLLDELDGRGPSRSQWKHRVRKEHGAAQGKNRENVRHRLLRTASFFDHCVLRLLSEQIDRTQLSRGGARALRGVPRDAGRAVAAVVRT